MCNVGIIQIKQRKPSFAPKVNKKMWSSSKSYSGLVMMRELLSSTLANSLHPWPQTAVQPGAWRFPRTHQNGMEHPNMVQQHIRSFSFTSDFHYTEGLYLGAQFDFEGVS